MSYRTKPVVKEKECRLAMLPSGTKSVGVVGLARSVPCNRDGVAFVRRDSCEDRYKNSRHEAHAGTENSCHSIRPTSRLVDVRKYREERRRRIE